MSIGPCVEWTASKNADGYGQQRFEGKCHLAHRIAYIKHHGIRVSEIKGLVVRHKCDNPACVNPNHLELGTQADNMRDAFKRGRNARGERVKHAKLTAELVAKIRARYVPKSQTDGLSAIAKEFGVTSSTIDKVVRNETWRS